MLKTVALAASSNVVSLGPLGLFGSGGQPDGILRAGGILRMPECGPASSDAGVVSRWSGESDVRDALGTHDGTAYRPLSFGEGSFGQAFSLDGASAGPTRPGTRWWWT